MTHSYRNPAAIVSTDWLQEHLEDPSVRIFDCTVYLHYETETGDPYRVESGRADYETKGHIPGAAFIDLQADLSNPDSPYRFTLLDPEETARRFGELGVDDGTRVVLYCRDTVQWATRIWWMLRYVGFDNAAILDGGWNKWALEGRPVSTEPVRFPAGRVTPRPRPEIFTGKEDVLGAIGDASTCTINALSPDLHSGENPRYGRPGRIPGSVNVPVRSLLDPTTMALPSPDAAAEAFSAVGAAPSKRSIVYCGGGIAATLDAFLLYQLGHEKVTVYDSSMSEWATEPSLPIETD